MSQQSDESLNQLMGRALRPNQRATVVELTSSTNRALDVGTRALEERPEVRTSAIEAKQASLWTTSVQVSRFIPGRQASRLNSLVQPSTSRYCENVGCWASIVSWSIRLEGSKATRTAEKAPRNPATDYRCAEAEHPLWGTEGSLRKL